MRTRRAGACTVKLGTAAREWDAGGRDSGELYRGARLAAALDRSAAHDDELTATERAFVDESRTSAAFTPDGRTLVTGGQDGDVIVWDVRRAAAGETLSGHGSGVQALAVARDGATVYTAGLDGAVFTWDLVGARRLGRPFSTGAGDPFATALSGDGRTLARGLESGAVRLVDLRTLARGRPFPVDPGGNPHAVRFVPGSRLLVVTGQDGFLALVDSASGRIVRRLRGPSRRGLRTRPERRRPPDGHGQHRQHRPALVAAGRAPSGRAAQGQAGPPEHRAEPRRAHADRDPRRPGHRALDGGDLGRPPAPARAELAAAGFADGPRFSPDGRLAAVYTVQTQVSSTATWTPVTRWLGGSGSGILSAQFSPDDRTLATGSQSGEVRLWHIGTQQSVAAPLPGPHTDVVPLFTPDGTHLIASYATGRAILWDIRPASFVRRACATAGRQLTRAEWDEFLPGRAYDPACR